MRTINSKAGNILNMMCNVSGFEPDYKQPCWYADVEKGDSKKEYKWKVGCQSQGKTEEFSFKFSKVGDVNDCSFWARITSVEFALKLLGLFKNGGAKSVKEWVKQGCP